MYDNSDAMYESARGDMGDSMRAYIMLLVEMDIFRKSWKRQPINYVAMDKELLDELEQFTQLMLVRVKNWEAEKVKAQKTWAKDGQGNEILSAEGKKISIWEANEPIIWENKKSSLLKRDHEYEAELESRVHRAVIEGSQKLYPFIMTTRAQVMIPQQQPQRQIPNGGMPNA